MATEYTFTNDSGTWKGTRTLSSSGNHTYRIKTSTTYVDKNIELTINAPAATPAFTGGALNNKSASATFTNMTTSTSNNSSGVKIETHGGAGRTAVTYSADVNGWVTKSSGDTASSAVSSAWDGTTYYATGVTLGNGKQFDITVPNGSSGTITFHFSVDNSGNTTVT